MAVIKLNIEITYENGSFFKVRESHNDGDPLVVLHLEENGEIDQLWRGVEDVLHTYLTANLTTIGDVMKA